MAIFSGRPDPEWSISSSHLKYAEIKQLLDNARTAGFVYDTIRMPPRLGYKGFVVKASNINKRELIVGPNTVKLQQLLLETAPSDLLPQGYKDEVLAEINSGNVRPGVP